MAKLPLGDADKMSNACFCCEHRQRIHPNGLQTADTTTSSSDSARHLVIMVNGIMGRASNWKFASDQFRLKYGSKVMVHCSARNSSTLTFDGVDIMGHRLAEEVKEVVLDSPNVTKISFVAHSLGGLIARYAVGQLFIPSESALSTRKDQEAPDLPSGTILGLQPVNFVTVATPHIGSKGNWQFPLLCGISFLEKFAGWKGSNIVGRTGKHLFLADDAGLQPPLLKRMVSDCPQGMFISSLKAFQRRVAYANIKYDHMVGSRTATFRRDSEFPEVPRQLLDSKYPHIIYIEDAPPDIEKPRKPTLDPVEEDIILGLRQMPWQRVYVSFAGTLQRFAAHNTIQVKHPWFNSDGADVIAHIIDNFVL